MAEKNNSNFSNQRPGLVERGMRFGRDFNIAVGTVALVGALLAPPVLAAGLGAYAGFNYLQAGGFEAGRRFIKNRKSSINRSY